MSEQDILSKCAETFPGIEKDEHKFPVADLLIGTPLKAASLQQDKLLSDLGLQASGSLLIDKANAAHACGEKFKEKDQNELVKKVVDTVETRLAIAALSGKSEAQFMDVGKGIGRVGNAYYDPPELRGAAKEVFEKTNASKLYKAELKADPAQKDQFYMMISLKPKR